MENDNTYRCALCGTRLHTANPKIFWCSKCFKLWESDILSNKEWTVYLRSLEKNRRYREKDKRDLGIVYIPIGDMDVAEVNGRNRLIITIFEEED